MTTRLMEPINSERTLQDAISALEREREQTLLELKSGASQLYESVKPVNLLKQTVQELTASEGMKEKLVLIGVAIAAGHLSKWLYQRISSSPFKRLIGAALQFGITNAIAHKPEVFEKVGTQALKVVKTLTNEHAA